MKIKTLGRICGIPSTAAGCYFGHLSLEYFSKLDYTKIYDVFSGEYPVEYKVAGGAIAAWPILASAVSSLLLADGLTDVVKGTHHYFGMNVWKN
jgi:hypothetical protein